MTSFVRRWLTGLAVLGCITTAVAKDNPAVVLHVPQGDFQKSIARVVFGSDRQLFAAYRVRGNDAGTESLHILTIDPLTGKIKVERSYPAPKVGLPRVVDDLLLSPDGSTLVYAELHAPLFLAGFRPQTLEMLSSSTSQLFTVEDFMPRVSGATQTTVVLSSERRTPNAGVRLVSIDLKNLGHVTEDSVLPFHKNEGRNYAVDVFGTAVWFGQGTSWFKHDMRNGDRLSEMHAREDINSLSANEGKLLGLTDKKVAGRIQLFDSDGKELADTRNDECGFVRVSLSPDRQFGVAICDRTGLDESHFGKTLRRQAIVFEVATLKVVASIPISRNVIKERGANPADFWIAIPTPALWHGNNRLLLALPGLPDSISVHSIPLPRK
jgi:hypothetical protein